MSKRGVVVHQSASDVDDDGWIIPTCTCGWSFGPVPDEETATDVLMDHVRDVMTIGGTG